MVVPHSVGELGGRPADRGGEIEADGGFPAGDGPGAEVVFGAEGLCRESDLFTKAHLADVVAQVELGAGAGLPFRGGPLAQTGADPQKVAVL